MNYKYQFFVLMLLIFGASCTSEKQPPNILFIAVDDLRPELGVYDKPYMKTPEMDALGSKGLVFNNHYVQVPTCGASRYALLTGMRPSKKIHLSNNVFSNLLHPDKPKEEPESIIETFKNNGYYTIGIGKISHAADGLVYGYNDPPSDRRELPFSWDEVVFNAGKWKTGWNAFFGYANGENRQSLKRQVKPYEKGAVDDQGYPDGLTTDLALQKLEELSMKNEPFFMGLGYFKPHLPFNAPKKYWDLYNPSEIALTPAPNIAKNTFKRHLQNNGEFNGYQLTDEKVSLNQPASKEYAQKIRQAYYASVSYIDTQIGIIVNKLASLNLADNTIIVIWGDHGWNLGDHRVWGKHTLNDTSLKSALIIYNPKSQDHLHATDKIVESVDIFPTLLDLCEINNGNTYDGKSFANLFLNDKTESNDVAYSYYHNSISVKTPHYRLTRYIEKDTIIHYLFDHKADPHENMNIAGEHPDIVNKLLPVLEKGITAMYK